MEGFLGLPARYIMWVLILHLFLPFKTKMMVYSLYNFVQQDRSPVKLWDTFPPVESERHFVRNGWLDLAESPENLPIEPSVSEKTPSQFNGKAQCVGGLVAYAGLRSNSSRSNIFCHIKKIRPLLLFQLLILPTGHHFRAILSTSRP